jgi:putative phosphoribosyl transferase
VTRLMRRSQFRDRTEAGRMLGACLAELAWTEPLVIGLARGGLPVAYEIARALKAPLEVGVVRKLGAPGQPEFGLGAVTPDGPPIYDARTMSVLGLTPEDMRDTCDRERAEARRRAEVYRRDREPIDPAGRDVLVVDDGLATGVTARAALRRQRERGPRRLVFTAPVCAQDAAESLRGDADEVECLLCPADFYAVGQFYRDFRQTTDDEVIALLDRAGS